MAGQWYGRSWVGMLLHYISFQLYNISTIHVCRLLRFLYRPAGRVCLYMYGSVNVPGLLVSIYAG